MFSELLKGSKEQFFSFPQTEQLMDIAHKTVDSCIHAEQVQVATAFFRDVVRRGVMLRAYKPEEAQKLRTLLDFLHDAKLERMWKSLDSMGKKA